MTIYDYRLAKIPFANAAPSSEIQPFPDYNLGLGVAFVQTDGKPEMKGLNGLFQAITVSLLYLRQRGISEWITDFEYPKNALVSYGDLLYKAKNANTSKQPNLSQNDWIIWASVSDINVDKNGNITKTTAADGSVTLMVKDADSAQKGVVRFATPSEVANQTNISAATKPSDISLIIESKTLGFGQKWYDMRSARQSGVTYMNDTKRPIMVAVGAKGRDARVVITINGVTVVNAQDTYDSSRNMASGSTIVPPNSEYKVSVSSTLVSDPLGFWSELR